MVPWPTRGAMFREMPVDSTRSNHSPMVSQSTVQPNFSSISSFTRSRG